MEDSLIQIEETQAALRASLERAHELICEAKQMMRLQEPPDPDAATVGPTIVPPLT